MRFDKVIENLKLERVTFLPHAGYALYKHFQLLLLQIAVPINNIGLLDTLLALCKTNYRRALNERSTRSSMNLTYQIMVLPQCLLKILAYMRNSLNL